ncbi:MAG: hypothetical protein AAF402_09475 [Pseudomonadota bacterium]
MITKVLFTLLVIIGVSFYFRTKSTPAASAKKPVEPPTESETAVSTRSLAYIMIALLIAISMAIFIYKWQSDNRIVNIRVMSDSGIATTYQARHKSIKGRSFTTLDGTLVNLGESDRIEMIEE